MEPTDSHSAIMLALGEMKGELSRGIEGVSRRLDSLNGSVGKHELRLNGKDILDAQMTMTQSQIVSDMKEMKLGEKLNTEFILKTQGSINTFKWLIGFIGVGTLITVLKIFHIIMIN